MSALTFAGYKIKELGNDYYEVKSPQGRAYTVNLARIDCDCADFIYRGMERPCKHIRMLQVLIKAGEISADPAIHERTLKQ